MHLPAMTTQVLIRGLALADTLNSCLNCHHRVLSSSAAVTWCTEFRINCTLSLTCLSDACGKILRITCPASSSLPWEMS